MKRVPWILIVSAITCGLVWLATLDKYDQVNMFGRVLFETQSNISIGLQLMIVAVIGGLIHYCGFGNLLHDALTDGKKRPPVYYYVVATCWIIGSACAMWFFGSLALDFYAMGAIGSMVGPVVCALIAVCVGVETVLESRKGYVLRKEFKQDVRELRELSNGS